MEQQEPYKRFQFFVAQPVPDQQNNPQGPTLQNIDISEALLVADKIYLASFSKSILYEFSNNSIQFEFKAFNYSFKFMRSQQDKYLITLGIDMDQQMKSSYIKIYDTTTIKTTQKPIRTILLGKLGQPMTSVTCISVAKDLCSIALGMNDGHILLIKANDLVSADSKDQQIKFDTEAIRSVFLSKVDNSLHLFFGTEVQMSCYQNLNTVRKLNVKGSNLFDLTNKGTLIGVSSEEPNKILELDDMKKVNEWIFEGEKLEIKSFKDNYVVMVLQPKEQKDVSVTQLVVFDYVNRYIAYFEKFQILQKVIISKDFIYIISLNSKGEKSLSRLAERDNSYKIETFSNKHFYDIMFRFAKNQSNDVQLLSEISKLHGDYLYGKHDYAGAIKHYKNTTDNLEPSYIISKFLDVSHIAYLIDYLEDLHQKKKADKNHTALLLNCFVKQKQIDKLEEFLKTSNFESDLFDIETAIQECKNLKFVELALRLAQQKRYDDYTLRILIEDMGKYKQALEHIQIQVKLEDKEKYLKEFGQILVSNVGEGTLELVKKMVLLQIASQSIRKRSDSRTLNEITLASFTTEEQEVIQYLHLSAEDIKNLTKITFKSPEEYFQLFFKNQDILENYLQFLMQFKGLSSIKNIVHRYLEFQLEKYQLLQKDPISNKEELQRRENSIISVLDEPELENNKKIYDDNLVLLLLKMYNHTNAIIKFLTKLKMKEELLHFLMQIQKNDKIIEVCKLYGENEPNLWINALRHFVSTSQHEQLKEVLDYVGNVQTLQPQLVLNILTQSNQQISFKYIKKYFIDKLSADRKAIEEDQKIVKVNIKRAEETKNEYKKLKTQAKVFQQQKCATCSNNLTLPAVHFLCGHSFHESCLNSEECSTCSFEFKRILEMEKQLKEQKESEFKEKLDQASNSMDVISQFLGKGLMKINED